MDDLRKFIRFTKVDSVQRLVSGIVTAERPDKELEVCDYEKSKPYYQKWSDEFKKATDGASLGNLREMHGLDAAGKATGLFFNDTEKQIEMTFKVVDDDAWKKVEERVYTGFSQGGRKVGSMERDPVFKNCMRYVANPTEVSLVDNPCLPDAHFAYVKSDGSVEMRKFLNVEPPVNHTEQIAELQKEVNLLKAASVPAAAAAVEPTPAKEVTKRVGDKDLAATNFAYVADPEKPNTWKIPIHDAPHVRKALAGWDRTKETPDSAKGKVRAKIVAAAKKLHIDLGNENDKMAAIRAEVRKAVRIYSNTNSSKIQDSNILLLDSDMGKMQKGMWEVSRLAICLEDICSLLYSVCAEQEWELDEESQLPDMLRENVSALAESLVAMVDEETREILEHVKQHAK
jgi:hypothetical protein